MKVYGLPRNPLATVERPRVARKAGIDVFSREEVMALVRAAQDDQDGVLYLTAAFTGLRLGELLGLRWEDVDFDAATVRVRRNWTDSREGTPKSGRDRAVPMMDDVAQALARLGQRDHATTDRDLVFCDQLGRHLGYKTLRARYNPLVRHARQPGDLPHCQPGLMRRTDRLVALSTQPLTTESTPPSWSASSTSRARIA